MYATGMKVAKKRKITPDKIKFCEGLSYRANKDAPISRLAIPVTANKQYTQVKYYRKDELTSK